MRTVTRRPFVRLRRELASLKRHSEGYATYTFWFPWGGPPLFTINKRLHHRLVPLTTQNIVFTSGELSGAEGGNLPVTAALKQALLGGHNETYL